jgi:cytochrome c-type biogenesis protein CcmH
MRLFVLPASTALAVLMTAAGYAWFGSADRFDRAAIGASATSPQPRAAASMSEQPIDADGWQAQGRSQAAQGRHAQAVAAFRNAARLRPDDATLLAEYAFSAAVTTRRTVADDPQRLVDRALRIDPKNTRALSLAGTLALDRSDYDAATQHWERLAQLEPPDSPMEREVQASIAQTRRLASAQAGRIELVRR